MGFYKSLIDVALLLVSVVNALPTTSDLVPISSRDTDSELIRRQNSSCTNTATSRNCWADGFDINTNWYKSWPDTGVVREYWLEVTNSTKAPDGYEKNVILFNNTYPGPLIEADWGDTIRVHLTNNVENNGTSIHWHGMRQSNNSINDGVAGVTQCPLAPGQTMTYEFQASQYGTTWYHSHFSLQYGEGALGPLVINGPASADYDVDVGAIIVQDWYHRTIFSMYQQAIVAPNPHSQSGLINGTNIWTCTDDDGAACVGGSQRWTTTFEKGKKYRLRFINTSVDSMLALELDNHTFTVISADLVPIEPFETKYLKISMGQRYDVVVTADQAVDNYWFRAYVQSCSTTNDAPLDILGIIRYEGADTNADPTSTDDMSDYSQSCTDMDLSSLVPIVEVAPDSSSFSTSVAPLDVQLVIGNGTFGWAVNGTSISIDWADPLLLQQLKGQEYIQSANTFTLPNANEWVYFVITDVTGVYHPIHLHGHDFSLLKQGFLKDTTDASSYDLSDVNFSNPMRRDVAVLPGAGYMVIGFETDNPGAWIMHCHIAWHISEGLGVTFVERPDEIFNSLSLNSDWNTTCAQWQAYDDDMVYEKDDSGLRKAKLLLE